MNTRSKVLSLLMAMMLVLVSIFAVSCRDDEPDLGPEKTEWPEAGVYYYDSGIDEYTLTLNVGDTFALIVKGESNSGSYTLDTDGNLVLDFSAEGKENAAATLADDVITLTYDGATMRFLKKVNYTVKFETNGGSTVANKTVLNGKTVDKPADPTRDKFIFVGWYADSEFKTPYAFGTQPVTADTTVYAQWSEMSDDNVEYTVTLNPNYEGAADLESVNTFGGKLFDLPTLRREGYEFHGWWISMDQDGSKLSYQYKDGMVLTENTTLYALWQQSETSNKLSAPIVNVEAGSVRWTAVTGARSYNIKVINAEGEVVLDDDVSATTVNVPFADYEAGEYRIVVTALATTGENNNSETVRFYVNKALGRVHTFNVFNSTLIFNTVENAEKYLITVVCGNPEHNHTNVDNGNSRTFSFANCVMPEEGIKFTVTAVADGYASSTSEYVHKQVLASVDGLAYNSATQTVTWKPVSDAAYYMVSVNCGNADHDHDYVNVGTSTFVNIKECVPVDGKVVVKVYPVTKGYASPKASELTCTKAELATPSGLLINGTVLSWTAVAGATEYEVKVGSNVYKVTANSYDLAAVLDYVEGSSYDVSVRAIGSSESLWSDVLNARYYELAGKLNYSKSTLAWTPVIGADKYEIQVNNGEIIAVTGGAYTSKITLNKAGVNLVKVRFVDGSHVSEWATVEVFAYAVTLDTRGGNNLGVQYKAIGDEMDLPTPTKLGYSFVQWYNAPGGLASNAMAYTDTLFAESGSIVLYAHYNPNKISIEYNYGLGGSASKTEDEVEYERDYQLVVPTPDSVTAAFGGWFSAPYGMGVQYTDAKGNSLTPWDSLEGVTLYAFWADPTLEFTLTKVNGKDAYMVSAGDRIALVDEINVPATYKGLPVLMVAGNAFLNCTNLKVVNLPSTIEQISIVDPFAGCSALEAINVYDVEGTATVRYWSEDGVLFYNGSTGASPASVAVMPVAKTGTYRVPDGIAEITADAFKGASISKVIIPASVTKIGNGAFADCINLTSVVFETSASGKDKDLTISAKAFAGCTKLEKIVLPARLTEINLTKYAVNGTNVVVDGASEAFAGCTSLVEINVAASSKTYKSVDGILYSADGKTLLYCPATRSGEVVIPTNVQNIAPGAFVGCSNITEVVIPNTIVYVGECAFYGLNTNLTKVTFKGNNLTTGVTVGKYAFRGCEKLEQLVLESGSRLTVLSEGAFYGCGALESFAVPASMTNIGKEAFRDCTGLEAITFAENGATLAFGESAFYNCTGLTSVALPANISEMPGIFVGCTSLAEVTVSDESEYFTSVEGVLFNKDKTEIVFFPQGKTGEYTLPATVKVINNGVFAGVEGLTRLVLPNTLEVIGDEAFKGFRMTGTDTEFVFEGNTFADSLVIGNRAFESAYIPSLTLPKHTKSVGEYSFYLAYFHKQIFVLNDGLENLGAYAFMSASGFETLDVPGSVKVIGDYCFADLGYYSNVTLNEGLEVIGTGAFSVKYSGYGPASITIPSTVVTIGDYAFADSRLATITFAPESNLKTIGAYAFDSCRMSTITIPKSVTSIGAYAFYYCSYLATVNFEEGGNEPLVLGADYVVLDEDYFTGAIVAEVIRGHVFHNCTKIATVNFPSRLTDLGEYTFYNTCSGYCYSGSALTVTFGDNSQLKTIGDYCFYNSHLHSIEIPKSVQNLAPVVNDEYGQSYDRLAIGAYAFGRDVSNSYCSFVGLPGGITFEEGGNGELTIGESAFCKALFSSIELPARLAPYTSHTGDVIPGLANGIDVFTGMTTLSTLDIKAGGAYYAVRDGVVYNAGFTELLFCPAGKEGEVTIPATVTKINDKAFYNCTKITKITFAQGGTDDMVIGSEAFAGCTAIETLALPDNVVSLGSAALKGCTALRELTLSKKLDSFSYDMIEGCNALETLAMGAGSNAIFMDNGVVYSADKTILIYYPAKLEATTYTVLPGTKIIAEGAFSGNSKLETVVLPAGLVEINKNAFNTATALVNIEIPNTVELIGEGAFQYCSKLAITFEEGGDAKLVISDYAFDHSGLAEVELPARLAVIGSYVFANSTKLVDVTFADNSQLTDIGNYVFQHTSIASIVFPEGLVSIGNYNFYQSSSIKNVVFGEGLQSMGEYNFEDSSLESVYLPASLKTMGINNFRLCRSLTEAVFAPGSQLSMLPSGTFGQSGLVKIVIPASVRELESKNSSNYYSYGVFEGCTSLASIVFENGSVCTVIGNNAFAGCSALTEFEIPASVITLGAEMFNGCNGIESITIPATVTQMGTALFKNCTKLSSVKLDTRATELPANMFEGCTAMTSITLPPYVTSLGENCFMNSGIAEFVVPKDHATLAVRDGMLYSKDLTQILACPPAKEVTSLTIPKDVTYIGAGAFRDKTTLKSIVFEQGGTEPLVIGNSAFYGCYQLGVVDLPERLTTIGSSAFRECTNLMYITLPENLTTIDNYAFYECRKLIEVFNKSSLSVAIGGGSLNGYVAQYAKNVYTPNDGASIISVDDNGFVTAMLEVSVYNYDTWSYEYFNLKHLIGYIGSETDIVLPDDFEAIYNYAFQNMGPFDSIIVPAGIAEKAKTSVDSTAFRNCGAPLILFGDSAVPSVWGTYWNYDYCPTICGFDNQEHTYEFVTALGTAPESLTSKYTVAIPVLENVGEMFFAGWYDNAEFTGAPISGSYYSKDKTTLYARWMTEEELLGGTDFEHAFELQLDTPVTVVIDVVGEKVYFKIVVAESGKYHFHAISTTEDSYAFLYDASGKEITYGDYDYIDGCSNYNGFGISYQLEAGQTYYLAACYYPYYSSYTGSFEISMKKLS